MIYRLLDFSVILLALPAVYGLPPFFLIRRVLPGIGITEKILLSCGAGLASQAVIGLLWNDLAGHHPWIEVSIYLGLWLVAGVITTLTVKPLTTHHSSRLTAGAFILPAIVLIGVSLRSLDALNHAALGQSDAYSHLQFLRHILKYGHILNIVYPPGYSWILALPTLTFTLDPYLVARYAGPFFGGLLILALYQLGRHHSVNAARFGAFLAACFPGFYLLIKTGMGAFANQLGLFFLPFALHLYLRIIEAVEQNAWITGLFILTLLGLATSVPLLLFNLLLIIAVHRLLCLGACQKSSGSLGEPTVFPPTEASPQSHWWRDTARTLLPFLPALLLAAYHFLRPGDLHVNATATMMTGIPTPAAVIAGTTPPPAGVIVQLMNHPLGRMLVDLLTIKRTGLGGGVMSVITLMLAATFAGILLAGFRTKSTVLKLLGGWGLLATLQTATGILDFSFYQRSGWSLLEAMVWAGGFMCATLYALAKKWSGIKLGLILGVTASVITAFCYPPSHRFITSGAEDTVVSTLRELSDARLSTGGVAGPVRFERQPPSPLMVRAARASKLILMTRYYTLFPGNQGDLAEAILDPAAKITQFRVGLDTAFPAFPGPLLCLLDGELDLGDMGILARISPELTTSLAGYQPLLYAPNVRIEAFLATLPHDLWIATSETRGPKLKMVLAERATQKSEVRNQKSD